MCDEDEENEIGLLAQLVDIEIGRRHKRPLCLVCSRPIPVCWCGDLAAVATSCRVVVLQHPHEEKRCLRTAPILRSCLQQAKYMEVRGKKFSFIRHPELMSILSSGNSLLMYPSQSAIDLVDLNPISATQPPYNIVILDGTWQQAKAIYNQNKQLHSLKQVRLTGKFVSEYIIRTQPNQDALSTVETAAIVLATLERDWSICERLIEPLKRLCQHQLSFGAVVHQSKEFLILNCLYSKATGKRTQKKMRRNRIVSSKVGNAEFKENGLKIGENGEELAECVIQKIS